MKKKTRDAAEHAAEKHDERDRRLVVAERLPHLFDRKGRVSVELVVARGPDVLDGVDQLLRCIELAEHAVKSPLFADTDHGLSSRSASGRMARISEMEMDGKKRMKRKRSEKKSPIDPR